MSPDIRPASSRAMTARRVLFHVQHLLGIGHWRRAAALAGAMEQAGLAVTVLAGGPPEPRAGRAGEGAGFATIQLPPARAADAGFKTIGDARGRPIEEAFKARRRDPLPAAF